MPKHLKTSAVIACAASLWVTLNAVTTVQADTQSGKGKLSTHEAPYTDRLIVKLREPGTAAPSLDMSTERLQALNASAGMEMRPMRTMSWGAQVFKLPHRMTLADATELSRKLILHPDVEHAEPDRILRPLAIPNDTLFSSQWHYMSPAIEPGGVNLPAAWDITTGQPGIVIGIIDSGILFNHADLAGRTLPGYDFVSEPLIANDGNGRDRDATDPGDWITAAESAGDDFAGCTVSDSSWHGTHIAGTVGAATNNGLGVAGTNWVSSILPVRVLGKCGGFLSDVIDGERWAVGLSVPDVPDNPTPAQVLNQSLGGEGSCSRFQQDAIDEIVALGTVIVASAGNQGADVARTNPANCDGVIAVAATNRAGSRTFYTNTGRLVDISAPGGEQTPDDKQNGILSLFNTGTTVPLADDYEYLSGTSFASAQVAGIVSLILSANPGLSPAQVLSGIQATARPFAIDSACTTDLCGAGIIDAAAAVNQVRTTLTVTASDAGAAETGLDPAVFTITRAGDTSAALTVNYTLGGSGSNGADYTVSPAPLVIPAGAGTATLTITPIDDSASERDETVTLDLNASALYILGSSTRTTATIVDNEPSSNGGGGGGCSLNSDGGPDPVLPLLTVLLTLHLLRRRYGTAK